MEPVNFKGLNHWPIDNANLTLTDDGQLKVSNLQKCSKGVRISTYGTKSQTKIKLYGV